MNYLMSLWTIYRTEDWLKYPGFGPRSKWQRVRAEDGPIRSVYLFWLKITCSWVVIGWHCHRHGHAWREEFITRQSQRTIVPAEKPGTSKWEKTGNIEHVYVKVCSWCGKYQGRGTKEIPNG